MRKIFLIFILTYSFAGAGAFAGIGCKPGMGGGCPDTPPDVPNLPGEGTPPLANPSETLAIGYFEVPSPSCDAADLPTAQAGARAAALADAQMRLETDDVIRTAEFRMDERCGVSVYANSYQGRSWIVQAFTHYSRQQR